MTIKELIIKLMHGNMNGQVFVERNESIFISFDDNGDVDIYQVLKGEK